MHFEYPIRQVAYLVDDVYQAANEHHSQFGSGPFHVVEKVEVNVEYRGRPDTPFTSRSGFGQWGDIQIELIESLDSGPSVLNEMYPPGSNKTGLHHVAVFADDLGNTAKRLEQAGISIALKAYLEIMDINVIMADTLGTYGHFIEIYQNGPQIEGFYEMVKSSAEGFDGKQLFRELSLS